MAPVSQLHGGPGAIAVLGGGAWGTALANAAAHRNPVRLWLRDEAAAAELSATRANARYLPGVPLHERIAVTASPADLSGIRAALLVVPAQAVRQTLRSLGDAIDHRVPLVLCAKGIEQETGLFLSQVVEEVRPGAPVAILSGPSFAADVARGLPTAVTLASRDAELAAELAAELSGPTFRVYHGTDVRGVEIGGAGKNVLAIACGAVIGRRLGESAKAALTARGFAELLRFASAYGARPETLMGLSGLGDVVLTCGSSQSRNFAFGERLGRGVPVSEAAGGKLAEGAFTAGILIDLARAKGIDMPVSETVAAVIAERLTVEAAISALMGRPLRPEHES